jgi:hypothetical protein
VDSSAIPASALLFIELLVAAPKPRKRQPEWFPDWSVRKICGFGIFWQEQVKFIASMARSAGDHETKIGICQV